MFQTAEGGPTGLAAKSRTRALILGIATGLGSRVLTLAAPLLTIPATLRYLGPDVFGFWMVITSITSMAMFADLGLGNGLLTKLAPSVAAGDDRRVKSLVSAAYFSLGSIALLLIVGCWTIFPFVPWAYFFGVSQNVDTQALESVAVFGFSAFALTIPLSLIQRIQYAFQEAWKSNMWQVGGALITVVAIYASVGLDLGPVAVIAAAVFSNPLVLLMNNLHYFWRKPKAAPSYRAVSSETIKVLLRMGFSFFMLSVIVSISQNADNVIVARVADLETVSQFAISVKLFSLLGLAVTLVALPLWPANGEALARGDVSWVRRISRIMTLSSGAGVAVLGLTLLLLRDVIAELWLGEGQSISLELAAVLVAWSVLTACTAPLFSVQNSVGIVRYQLMGWLLFALVSVPVKILMYGWFGLSGVIMGGFFCYLTFVLPSAYAGYRAALKSASCRSMT
ncbi:lipopolysaccharide biosynthesis protein [Arthrobacter sp. RT-1]|uniref:lipopolysaccharide biosynthesis protein n=1 Tax=Arthrobacter sp. RT-1 TaxID=2292263 RepID=UPI0011C031B4|nr:hypothetical protein [Arthrobacter sp. RT-1]